MTSRQEWPHLSQRSTEALNRMTQVLNKRHAIFSNELIPHTLRAKLITIFEVARQVSTILFRMHIQVDSHVSEERFFFCKVKSANEKYLSGELSPYIEEESYAMTLDLQEKFESHKHLLSVVTMVSSLSWYHKFFSYQTSCHQRQICR